MYFLDIVKCKIEKYFFSEILHQQTPGANGLGIKLSIF